MPNLSKKQQDDLIKYLGLEHLSEKERLEVVKEVNYTLNMQVMKKAYEMLTEKQKEEINQYIEAEDAEKVWNYMSDNVRNFQKIFQNQVEEIKETMKQKMEEMKNDEMKRIKKE